MNTTQKVCIGAAAAVIVIGGAAAGLLLRKSPDKLDISTIHQEAPLETTAQSKETQAQTSAPQTSAAQTASVTASTETYQNGKVSIQYPVVEQMSDEAMMQKVNDLLKKNALSFLSVNGVDEEKDSVEITCKVISVDRKRITATYTGLWNANGAAHPTNVFFSNTVDLMQGEDVGFNDLTDAYTMAGYLLSEDVQFEGLNGEQTQAVLNEREQLSLEDWTQMFNEADFPLKVDGVWPESFSFEKQGSICFSIPVSHALGDYVIVTFDPTTK